MRELRNGGQRDRYHHVRLGFCNRLDEIQAAILRVKLRYWRGWNAARAERAAYYDRLLAEAGQPGQAAGMPRLRAAGLPPLRGADAGPPRAS